MPSQTSPYESTGVSVERSKDQIRKFLREAGALGVQFDEEWGDDPVCRVRFVWPIRADDDLPTSHRQTVRLEVTPLPPKSGGYGKGPKITAEQRERQAWRGLAHYLEGTIKAARFGLIRFEDIFLSFMEVGGGDTRRIGDVVIPQMEAGRLALPRGDG
jgi:hypothetical protein